jgi:hypothetical protein
MIYQGISFYVKDIVKTQIPVASPTILSLSPTRPDPIQSNPTTRDPTQSKIFYFFDRNYFYLKDHFPFF